MLLSFKRIRQLFPILLIIIVAVLVTSYKDEIVSSIRSSVDDEADSISGRILGSVVNVVLPEEETGKEDASDDEVENSIPNHVIVETEDSEYEVRIEVADSEEERVQGLMYRESLCDNCGMLFVFEEDEDGSFWMKNCEIPLDVIFIDKEGLIVDMKEDFEPCPAYPCPTYEPEHSYRYVLEVNGGWAEAHEVKIGDTIGIFGE